MDYSVTFARHFARLLWLLSHEPANTDEQKAALRALVTIAREGFVILGTRSGQLTANGTALPSALSGVPDAVARMTACGTSTIEIDRNASASDIIRVARHLAAGVGELAPAPGGTVRCGVATQSPAIGTGAAELVPAPESSAFDFGEVLDDPLAAALERGTPHRAMRAVPTAPAASPRTEAGRRGGSMFDQFAAAGEPTETHGDLLARMDAESDPTRLIELLDELAARAEEAIRDDRSSAATEIFYRVVRRERDSHELDVKRAFVLAVKRLTKPALLKAVVVGLARSPEEHAQGKVVLARAGEDGADAVIEQLAAEQGRKARLVYFDVLVQLQAGVPTLVHMLGDARWYVARNAAALLGEMQAREADNPLAGLLHHDDERVRHAATVSLMRLGTSRSMPTIQDGLRDGAPQIRMQAAAALVGRRESNVTALLLRALDEERDAEVAASFLLALGRLATPEAVARLIASAEPDKGLFRRKPVALRVAAVQGLSEARTPEALDALKRLHGDKDEDVRATAVYAVGRRVRTNG